MAESSCSELAVGLADGAGGEAVEAAGDVADTVDGGPVDAAEVEVVNGLLAAHLVLAAEHPLEIILGAGILTDQSILFFVVLCPVRAVCYENAKKIKCIVLCQLTLRK